MKPTAMGRMLAEALDQDLNATAEIVSDLWTIINLRGKQLSDDAKKSIRAAVLLGIAEAGDRRMDLMRKHIPGVREAFKDALSEAKELNQPIHPTP